MQKFLKKIFGDESAKILKNLEKEAEPINALESGLIDLDDIALQAKTADFKKRIADGETLDDIAYEAFAVVREAAKRTLSSVTMTCSLSVDSRFIAIKLRRCVRVKEKL